LFVNENKNEKVMIISGFSYHLTKEFKEFKWQQNEAKKMIELIDAY